jgi:predicted SAM-dependent methyltransferase
MKTLIKKIIYGLYPDLQRYNLELRRFFYQKKLALSKSSTIQRFKGQEGLLINVGCGSQGKSGWINLDYRAYEGVTCVFNCAEGLPFENNSVRGIFTEHFFEHLDYETEASVFLSDSFRVLQPGRVIRIIVPDAEKLIRAYCSPNWEELSIVRPLTPERMDFHLGCHYNTKMELINMIFRQHGEHKFAYDYETLKFCLEKVGFTRVMKMRFGQGCMAELIIDLKERESESLYVEAVKEVTR